MKLNNKINVNNVVIKRQIDIIDDKNRNRQKIIDFFVFVVAKMKIKYDKEYKLLIIKFNDKIYVKFYHEYKLFKLKNIKLFNQKMRSFRIFK